MDDATDKSSVRSHSTVDHPEFGPICYRKRSRKPSRWSVVSRRISMMGGRNAAMFRSSKNSTIVPPKPRVENTFKIDPDTGTGFKPSKVEEEVSIILERVLKYEEYDTNCGRLAARLTELIKSKAKEFYFSRHKLVVHVVIGSQQGQSLEIASRCLWNQSTDNFCSAWYQNGLLERLNNGETVLIAEGYLFAFERRGYLQAGAFVPEVVIEHPDMVKGLHREFVHAGSDVVLAFTYYAHRKKMQVINREADLERINREALRIAKEVADESGTLLAGNICNTGVYTPGDEESYAKTKAIFKEQIEWALDYEVDFIIAETFPTLGEAKLALEAIKEYGKGVPSVVSFITAGQNTINGEVATLDGFTIPDACKQLEDAGADVVGMNCCRGPETMMPVMEKVRAVCKGHLAAIPVPYRTTPAEPTFFNIVDPKDGNKCFPTNMDIKFCNRSDMVDFGKRCQKSGINFVGICCGNSAHLTRALAESYGRTPPGSRYSAKMENHFIYGTNPCLVKYYNEQKQKLF